MKKDYKPIPYEIFLSELYINLKEYYHSEKKKLPIFRLHTECLKYMISHIESYSNNKVIIDKNTDLLKNYNIDIELSQITLMDALVPENLYPPYFHPNWRKYIKEGILSYLFNNPSIGLTEYFSKSDVKFMKKYPESQMTSQEEDLPIEQSDIPKKTFFQKLLWWI